MTAAQRISLLFFLVTSCLAQQKKSLPVLLQQVPVEGGKLGSCPRASEISRARVVSKEAIRSILRDTVAPILDGRSIDSHCPCGGPGQWHKTAFLDMSNSTQQCPSNWRLVTTPERACGRSSSGSACDSATFSTGGRSYSRVCGRISAYQRGTSNAFEAEHRRRLGLENVYVDGVSLTYGAAGSRQHIWTFVAAAQEVDPAYDPVYNCPCTNTTFESPYPSPSFVANNYFCDTGNRGPGYNLTGVYLQDPLWDGRGCGPTSSCCEFNTPPWFCTALVSPTSDDIELRICGDQDIDNEDIDVRLVEIYTM